MEELTAYKEYQLLVDKENENAVEESIEGMYTFVDYEGMYIDVKDVDTVDQILTDNNIPFRWGDAAVNMYQKDSSIRIKRSYVKKGRTLLIDIIALSARANLVIKTRSGEHSYHKGINGKSNIPVELMGAEVESLENYPGGIEVLVSPVDVIEDGGVSVTYGE